MKVLLISANTEPINMPIAPLGLGCVAEAARRAGHEVDFLDLMRADGPERLVRDRISGFNPELIGISVRNIDDQVMEGTRFLLDGVREIVSVCREASDSPIVLGGAGYSIFPESALKYLGADMGVLGEGEIAFPELLNRIEKGEDLSSVPGLCLADGRRAPREFAKGMDGMPLPDPGLWPSELAADPELWMPLQTRRGCPMDCSYCSTSSIEGRLIRKRDIEKFADAMASYVEAGFKRFFFTDNVFNLPVGYARGVCRALGDRDLDALWRCIIYPGKQDQALIADMAAAGCVGVALGFESGSDKVLTMMHKKYSAYDVRRASEMLKGHGIARMGFLLLGGPGETRDTVMQSLEFADSLKLEAVKVTTGIRIYPDTALADAAIKKAIIKPDDDLLFPGFYLEPEIKDWLKKTVEEWMAKRPNWMAG